MTLPNQPYRFPSSIEKYKVQEYGLIKKTRDNPWLVPLLLIKDIYNYIKSIRRKHKCNYPGKLTRMRHWLLGSPFGDGSLFKCKCGIVYSYNEYGSKWQSSNYYRSFLTDWNSATQANLPAVNDADDDEEDWEDEEDTADVKFLG